MTKSILLAGLAALAFVSSPAAAQTSPEAVAEAALKKAPVFDGHNDVPWALRERADNMINGFDFNDTSHTATTDRIAMHTDLIRLRKGHVGAQFWSVYVPSNSNEAQAVQQTQEQIDVMKRLVQRYPNDLMLATSSAELEKAMKAGKIAGMMGMEGGQSIGSSLAVLRQMYDLGARYMTLTHSKNVPWADSATDTPEHGGLTPFGEDVIREMNRLGMLVDLSHVSPDTMEDVLRVTTAPVIFSHSSARALCDQPRNVPDAILKKLPANGGVVMVSFVRGFTTPEAAAWDHALDDEQARVEKARPNDEAGVKAAMDAWRAAHPRPAVTIAQVADHIDHVRKVAGIDHVGIGSDFDGISAGPDGLEDVSTFPKLTAELLRRGYSDADVKKVLGLNLLRVMRAAEAAAARMNAAPRS